MATPSELRRSFLCRTSRILIASAGIIASPTFVAESMADEKEKSVEANEDLMREHGVLRRALLVYQRAAYLLRTQPASVPADALLQTSKLFRVFGEDYHERKLEEKYIFPLVRKLKGQAASYPDVLEKQHDQGRKLTKYVMEVTQGGRIARSNVIPLANALDAFDLMYAHHAAREDTIVFPAWKDALSERAYQDMSEKFEDIEKQTFGHDGFEDAVRQIAMIESRLDLTDISQFTIHVPEKK
jgi:hemerythrin-like domain-containing protein